MPPPWDRLWLDLNAATMAAPGDLGTVPYGAIPDAAIASSGDRICWMGRKADLPGRPEALAAAVHRLDGAWVTPGLIDCHTHLVHGGDRAAEWEARLNGASYADIAAAGGGILRTVSLTRAASEDALLHSAGLRLRRLIAEGVTSIEIKSGYGLDRDTELKMLRVARRLGRDFPVTVRTSLLAAHAIPPEFRNRREDYLTLIIDQILPQAVAEGLVDAVDAFCEGIAFTADETRLVFEAARRFGLPVRLHADQLSDSGGAALAADFSALSADHLEHAGAGGLAAMAAAGTVAVLLPTAFYCLRETVVPPVQAMRAAGVAMAVATDCNPGTSPCTSLLLALHMACTLFRLTPEEALTGATRHAAQAIGLGHDRGILAVGRRADLAIWNVDQPAAIIHGLGTQPCRNTVVAGQPVLSDRLPRL